MDCLHIAPGERIAIVGINGAGKTTLSKLLLRLYDVQQGEVRINGIPIEAYQVDALRMRVGVAFQEPQLYPLSVRENLCVYGSTRDDSLQQHLKQVGLELDLQKSVTKEFDEDGLILSKGQQKRLSLSRLLVRDFGLLILDEPSSSLDPLAEHEIAELLFNQSSTTTIMIAHRLSTIRKADRIYVFDGGKIVEEGTHESLMQQEGLYRDLFTKQAEGYLEPVADGTRQV